MSVARDEGRWLPWSWLLQLGDWIAVVEPTNVRGRFFWLVREGDKHWDSGTEDTVEDARRRAERALLNRRSTISRKVEES